MGEIAPTPGNSQDFHKCVPARFGIPAEGQEAGINQNGSYGYSKCSGAGRSAETRIPPTRDRAPLLHRAMAIDLLLLRSSQGRANFPPHVVRGADSESPRPFSVRSAPNGNFGRTPAEVPTTAVCRLSYSFQSLPLSSPPPSAPPSLLRPAFLDPCCAVAVERRAATRLNGTEGPRFSRRRSESQFFAHVIGEACWSPRG